jgi:hypothetical protein
VAILGRFFGSTVATGAGFAFGHATSPVLAPAIEELRQEAWNQYQSRIPDAVGLAAGVAEGKVDEGQAREWAHRHGFGDGPFDAFVAMARTAPDVGTAMQAWRRGKLSPGEFATVLERHGIDAQWNAAIEALKDAILSPGELAAAIHRGLVPNEGLVLGEQPAPPFKVEAYPVENIDAVAEAAGSGLDRDRLQVLVGLQGLPMGPHEAAQALFRGVITHGDYIRAFNTSNMRNEWAQAILDQSRQIPTARDFLENALRGYSNLNDAIAGAARHGMSPEDATLIYQNQGRPMNVHQITQALARGAKFHPEPGEITDPYLASTVEGPIKPAYYEMNQALKYVVPGVFAIRALTESGVWDEAKAAERLKWSGWFPPDADEVAHAWASGGGTTADPHVAKAQTQLWTTTHASYKAREIAAGTATAALEKAGVTAAAVPTVLDIWNAERDLIRARLQASDVRKAYQKQDENPATGAAWTRADAVAELLSLGWDNQDAEAYLNIG